MRAPIIAALVLYVGAPAFAADEPSGCDKFKWPIERERAALTAPDRAKLALGVELPTLPADGVTLALVAPTDAKLPTPPERSPKEGTFAGFVATDCDGIRKTVKFELSASPLVVQVSGAKENSISIAILPTER
jgi:hypothetical protein